MPASIKHLTDRKVSYNSLLARWTDGLYYTAALIKCDRANKRCRVCFEDGSEVWLRNRDLHIQLSLDQINEDDDIVCCICDDGNSEAPNEIILCDVCNQGYHQKCHSPPVDSSKLDDSEETKDHKDWFCSTCSYILNQTDRAKVGATVTSPQQQQPQKRQPDMTNLAAPSPPKQQTTKVPTPPTVSQQQLASKPKKQAIADGDTRGVVTAATAAALTTATTEVATSTSTARVTTTAVIAPIKATKAVPTTTATKTTATVPVVATKTTTALPVVAAKASTTVPTATTKATITAATASEIAHVSNNQALVTKHSPSSKVKQNPISTTQHQPKPKPNISCIKTPVTLHQRSAPYYPLSSQIRASGPTSSTAALASMTASSALVVGSSVGRSKQDLVKQSNKSSQRQLSNETGGSGVISAGPALPKHAVRKSSVNFVVSQVKQSALPTATRSLPSSGGSSNSSSGSGGSGGGGGGGATFNNVATTNREPNSQMLSTTPHSSIAKPIITMTLPTSAPTVNSQSANASYTITALTSQTKVVEPKVMRNDTVECVNVIARTANGQPTNEQRSAISTINSSQQVSGLSLSKVIESNSRAASSGASHNTEAQQKQKAVIDRNHSNSSPSSSNSSPQRVESTTQQTSTPDNFNSKNDTDRQHDTSANKPTTVIVGVNIK